MLGSADEPAWGFCADPAAGARGAERCAEVLAERLDREVVPVLDEREIAYQTGESGRRAA